MRNTVTVAVSINPEDLEILRKVMKEYGIGMSAAARMLIRWGNAASKTFNLHKEADNG